MKRCCGTCAACKIVACGCGCQVLRPGCCAGNGYVGLHDCCESWAARVEWVPLMLDSVHGHAWALRRNADTLGCIYRNQEGAWWGMATGRCTMFGRIFVSPQEAARALLDAVRA